MASAPVVVIGVGNALRADDAAGVLAGGRLAPRPGGGVPGPSRAGTPRLRGSRRAPAGT